MYKNIILDLGGVIINLNQGLTQEAFQKLFADNFEQVFAAANTENIFENYEEGKISTKQFLAFFKQFNSLVSDSQLLQAWNSMLIDIPNERISLIEQLRKKYRIFLLSNTNEVHYNFIEDYYKNTFKNGEFKSLFDNVFLSYELGFRKPSVQIFKHVIEAEDLTPQDTLFIDDSVEHINSALLLNIQANHLNIPSQTLNTFFNAN